MFHLSSQGLMFVEFCLISNYWESEGLIVNSFFRCSFDLVNMELFRRSSECLVNFVPR